MEGGRACALIPDRAVQYLSQNFIKGDRVSLLTASGVVVVTGVVESISLLYTTIRSDASMPISIPNKVIDRQPMIQHRTGLPHHLGFRVQSLAVIHIARYHLM